MYREREKEMKQLLRSLFRCGKHFKKRIESHIFIDGAIQANGYSLHAIQLLTCIRQVGDVYEL